MNSHKEENEITQIHVITPLLHSMALSKIMPEGTEIHLKLENSQPTGSFKVRGIGRLVSKLKREGCQRVIGASGGNAGLATAYTARALDMPCTIFVPETAPKRTIERIKANGAEVKIIGENYGITEQHALKEAKTTGNGFIHPYNNPELWAGHSTVVDELKTQLPKKPSAIVVAVGGGGLLLGILQGLQNVGWQDVPVVAMETYGAHCFNLAVKAKAVVFLEKITSVATCLGASTVSQYLMDVLPNFNVLSEVVSDKIAIESCIRFADDERVLVEPACGAALAAVYGGVLEKLQLQGKISSLKTGPVPIIVCGGGGVSLQMLQEWATKFNLKFPLS